VSRGPKGGTMAQRCEDGAAAAVRSAGTNMRPRKERREDERGKKKGGTAVMGHPL
jgi:hypothetical protein